MLQAEWKRVINEIEKAIRKTSAANRKDQERSEKENNALIASPLGSLADQFERYNKQQEASDKSRRRREIATIIGVFATAFFTLVAAGIFYFQLVEMRAASKISERTLISSSRPWVMADGVQPIEPFPHMDTYCRVGYKVIIKNSGVSVANSTVFDSRAIKFPPNLDWLAKRVDNLRVDVIKAWSTKRPETVAIGVALAPGQAMYPIRCPAYGDDADPTDSEISKGVFLIIGYIQYADQFGLLHHTRFAFIPDTDSVRAWDGKSYIIYNDYQDAD